MVLGEEGGIVPNLVKLALSSPSASCGSQVGDIQKGAGGTGIGH